MKKSHADPLKTILVISMGFLVIYYFKRWNWALNVSLIIGIVGLFSTYLRGLVNMLWMKLTWLLGLIVPNVLLTGVFFLILFPLSIFSKLFRKKDVLLLKNNLDSTFEVQNKVFSKESFEKIW